MDIDDVSDEEEFTPTLNFKPSFVLIAIDTHRCMFETRSKAEDEDEETHPFKDALTACYEIADSLIFSTSRSNYNQFGIVLADEDRRASFIEVENNLLDTVKLLQQTSSMSNDELQREYEREDDLDLGAFFLLCKKKFKAINSTYYKRTIIYITNDDDPVGDDAQKRFTALNEAKTFEAGDILFQLITMKKEYDFDYTIFYNELFHLYTKPPTIDEVCEDKDSLVERLQSSIVFRTTKLRMNFYPFKNDPSRFLKVMRVSFIRKPLLHNTEHASLDGKLLKEVKADLGVDNPDIGCDFQLAVGANKEDTLNLELKDQYDIFGNDMPLGLHLQYISKRQCRPGIVLSDPTILIVDPKEELPYLDHFWQYCTAKNRVLVCIKKYKHPTEIRYVQLIPKFVNKQKQFLIVDLPFSEDLMIPKEEVQTVPRVNYERTEEKKEVVRALVDKLTFPYDPKMFIDPSYGKKKAFVRAKLLNEPEEEVEDPTEDTGGIDDQIKDIVSDIKRVFRFTNPQGTKRKGDTSSGRGRKAAK